jgi:hypothetical protein
MDSRLSIQKIFTWLNKNKVLAGFIAAFLVPFFVTALYLMMNSKFELKYNSNSNGSDTRVTVIYPHPKDNK